MNKVTKMLKLEAEAMKYAIQNGTYKDSQDGLKIKTTPVEAPFLLRAMDRLISLAEKVEDGSYDFASIENSNKENA